VSTLGANKAAIVPETQRVVGSALSANKYWQFLLPGQLLIGLFEKFRVFTYVPFVKPTALP
jgi:hypothetical protein